MPQIVWTARPDGFIDFYNRRWFEYTGTTWEDMQGWGWRNVHAPETLPEVVAAFAGPHRPSLRRPTARGLAEREPDRASDYDAEREAPDP